MENQSWILIVRIYSIIFIPQHSTKSNYRIGLAAQGLISNGYPTKIITLIIQTELNVY